MLTGTIRYLSILLSIIGVAGAMDRVRGPVEPDQTVALSGTLSPRIGTFQDLGAVAPETRIEDITLIMTISEAQQTELDRFLEAQRDPSSPDYQNWLTPEQFGERFGLTESDFGVITSWLQANGFEIDNVARARNWIRFSGSAGQIARTFHAELRRVSAAGESHFANRSAVRIPAAFAAVIGDIRGLDDFRPKPLHTGLILSPEFNASGGTHYLAPGDFATIYDVQALYNAGYDGAGQKLAIVGQSAVSLADLRSFRLQFGLPPKDPQMVVAGSAPGSNQSDQTEASLDLEWAGAIARNATIVYVYSPNVFQSLQYAIDDNLAPVVSMSYGGCELQSSTTYRTLAQQANAQGITWLNASGDSGAAGCDAVGAPQARQGLAAVFPADIPEVTAVGGTEFNEGNGFYWQAQNNASFSSAVSWIPEKAWNDSSSSAGIVAGGGAASLLYPKPWWQTGPGVPNDNARDVPDVAFAASGAHDAYSITVRGQSVGIGGTSAASPAFAGIVSILNQYLLAKGTISKPGLGNINPAFYNLAQHSTDIFHDIVSGNNEVPCAAAAKGCVNGLIGYAAGAGYDLATGLGSVDAFNLSTKWTTVPPVPGTALTLTATPASITAAASTQLIATAATLSGTNPPAGSITFLNGTTVLGASILSGSGATATANLTVKGSSLKAGVNTITANFGNQSASTNVSVAIPAAISPVGTTITLTASPGSFLQSASTSLTVVVHPVTGATQPTGTVVFTLGNTTLASVNLLASVASLTVKGANLPVGPATISANYVATGNFSNSNTAVTVTVLASPRAAINTTIAVALNATSLPQSSTAIFTATVKPVQGTALPTGIVLFTAGNNLLAQIPLTASGPASTATLAVKGSVLAVGPNLIVASYLPAGNFGASSASATLNVTAVSVTTTLTLTSAPGNQPSTTVFTATVKAVSGNSSPVGNVAFALGTALLGTGTLAGGAGTATATLTVNNNVFAVGSNTITASFPGSPGFSSSSGAATVRR